MQQVVEFSAAQSLALVREHERCLHCWQHTVIVHLQTVVTAGQDLPGESWPWHKRGSLQVRSLQKSVYDVLGVSDLCSPSSLICAEMLRVAKELWRSICYSVLPQLLALLMDVSISCYVQGFGLILSPLAEPQCVMSFHVSWTAFSGDFPGVCICQRPPAAKGQRAYIGLVSSDE